MHIKVEKERILGIVDHVEGIVEKRNTIPILSNILIKAERDNVSVTATDLDILVTDKISNVEVENEGSTTVSASTFSALIRKMPPGSMIDMKVENERMTIRSGRIRYQIPVISPEDFPIGKPTEGQSFEVSVEAISRAFKLIKDSMSTEESRYYLNGSYLAVEDGNLLAVSTDGHRLGIALISKTEIEEPDIIVPRKAVTELIKILSDFKGNATVQIDERSIQFTLGDLVFTTKVIDGTFPDYKRVIPAGEGITIKVDPVVLQQALERVSIVSTERTRVIKMKVEKEKITILVNSIDSGDAQEEVPAESSGEITLGYNVQYLREILSGYQSSEVVTFIVANESSPALILPDNSKVDRSVLMPMRI